MSAISDGVTHGVGYPPAYAINPLADEFPILAGEELQALAADIRERGLLHPILLDEQERILDGRSRLAACEIADVAPSFETYTGVDPIGHVAALNLTRRHLSQGQRAMLATKILLATNNGQSDIAAKAGVSQPRISQAKTVLNYAPELVAGVVKGEMSLDDAVHLARARKLPAPDPQPDPDPASAQRPREPADDSSRPNPTPDVPPIVAPAEVTEAGGDCERKSTQQPPELPPQPSAAEVLARKKASEAALLKSIEDDEMRAHDHVTKFVHALAQALKVATAFDAGRIADLVDEDQMLQLTVTVDALVRFAAEVKRRRSGLRLVGGTAS